jgi:hypothetical protein
MEKAHIFSLIMAVCFTKNMYQFTRTEQKAPVDSQVHRFTAESVVGPHYETVPPFWLLEIFR